MAVIRSRDFPSYFRYEYPRIVSELDFMLGDLELARDVAQDAFIRQYVSWTRLSHYDKPGAWVRRVAIRLAFKARRKMSRFVAMEDDASDSSSEGTSERRIDVRNAIGKLPERQRAAIVLHYYRDLPVKDVARALGVREPTAKAHLVKARTRLAELLVSYAPEGAPKEEISNSK